MGTVGRRFVVHILGWMVLSGWIAAAAIAQPSPNIIMIVTDDQGVDAIEGAYWPNTMEVHTPTLATLAAQGRVFTNTRVESRCSPTRAGIMTGRSILHTGVTSALAPHRFDTYISLQGEELTIAETLTESGYHTILIDKWHLAKSRNQTPKAQGFAYSVAKKTYFELDDPIAVGDEHLSLMTTKAIKAVQDRDRPDAPYALFFWTSDPHIRVDRTLRDQKGWWWVHKSLLPSEETYYNSKREKDTQRNRYRAVVEAVDTETRRMLTELGVIDEQLRYRPESNTVVMFMSDNGTPSSVAPNLANAKGTLYDGGIRVPLFVFGQGVPADGLAMPELISHVDLFDTIADIARAPDHARDGGFPRDGVSFADLIGWGPPGARRTHTVSAGEILYQAIFRACITDGTFKVIANGGGAGFKSLDDDEFYDLIIDPGEQTDIEPEAMTPGQRAAYRDLRERLADAWPYSVPVPDDVLDIDIPATAFRCLTSENEDLNGRLTVGHNWIARSTVASPTPLETRSFIRFDLSGLADALSQRNATVDDIASARLILSFDRDISPLHGGVDAGRIDAFEMLIDWRDLALSYDDLDGMFALTPGGHYDPPPHLFAEAEADFQVVPTPPGTPVNFGRNDTLTDAVIRWMERPDENFGLVLVGTPLPELDGDQRTQFLPEATLRVSLHGTW